MTSTPLEVLLERTTIDFPKNVRIDELRKIFLDTAERVDVEFDFGTELSERIGDVYKLNDENANSQRYEIAVRGVVKRKGGFSAQFTCKPEIDFEAPNDPVSYFRQIKFQTTPGYDSIEELDGRMSDDLETMDLIRGSVCIYFLMQDPDAPKIQNAY